MVATGSSVRRISENGIVRVGVCTPCGSPFVRGESLDSLTGFDIDLLDCLNGFMAARLFFSSERLSVEYVDYDSMESLLEGAMLGEVDLALGSISRNSDRMAEGLLFSIPYMDARMGLVGIPSHVGPAAEERKLDDLLTPAIELGAVDGMTSEDAAEALREEYGCPLTSISPKHGYPKALARLFDGLGKGALNYIVLDMPLAVAYIGDSEDYDLRDITEELTKYYEDDLKEPFEQYAVVVPDDALLDVINDIMRGEEYREVLGALKAQHGLERW